MNYNITQQFLLLKSNLFIYMHNIIKRLKVRSYVGLDGRILRCRGLLEPIQLAQYLCLYQISRHKCQTFILKVYFDIYGGKTDFVSAFIS